MMNSISVAARRFAYSIVVLLVIGVVASIPALGRETPDASRPIQELLVQMERILLHVEAELAALRSPAAERLEDRLEEVVERLSRFLDTALAGSDRLDADAAGLRLMTLDLSLHRFAYLLRRVADDGPVSLHRDRAKSALEDLRNWLSHAANALTADLEPTDAARLEDVTSRIARMLGRQLVEIAGSAAPGGSTWSGLVRLADHLDALLFRLDGLILNASVEADSPARQR